MNETLNFYENCGGGVVKGYGGRGGWNLGRVPDVRFSKCSGLGDGGLTQPLDIRHPWAQVSLSATSCCRAAG